MSEKTVVPKKELLRTLHLFPIGLNKEEAQSYLRVSVKTGLIKPLFKLGTKKGVFYEFYR